MEMRLLEYALAVYRNQSFTKAASCLHIAQPSLSKQIANLEEKLGVRLFIRGNRTVKPTPDGIRFFEQAEKIVRMRDDLKLEMLERNQEMGSDLVVGSTAVTGGHILPALLKVYNERYPHVSIRLVEESTEKLTDLTVKGLVDIAILSLPLEDSRLATKTIVTEPLYLVLPPEVKEWMSVKVRKIISVHSKSVHSNSSYLSIEDVANAPFIMLKQGFGFRRTVLELCAKSGFQPYTAYETSSIETAQSLVMHGLGVTVVPEMVVHQDTHPSPLYLKLVSEPTRTLVFTYNSERYLSMASRAFINIYEEQNHTK